MTLARPWLAALFGAILLASCQASEDRDARKPNAEPVRTLPPLPVAEPPLDREQLLFEIARAASAYATERNDLELQRPLDGKRFELRLRFGCPADSWPSRRMTFDDETRVLRLRAEPEISASTALIESLGQGEFEAVEGFWIRRPWLLAAGCPARARGPASAEAGAIGTELSPRRSSEPTEATPADRPPQPRVGIAQFFTAADPRGLRRDGRAFEATKRFDDAALPSAQGYDLVLSGRLNRRPDGRVIACAGEAADLPPSCIVSVSFDSVAMVHPRNGEVLAEWTAG